MMINRYLSHKRTIARWLAILLIATVLPLPVTTPLALAQAAPAACLNDAGGAVLPAPIIGAWALVLNFNHTPSTTETTACRVTTIALQPAQQVSYTLVACKIVNNSSGAQVGAGTASFDGNFSLSCPNGPTAAPPPYNGFLVYGRMGAPTSPAVGTRNFTLLQHPDVEFTATVTNNALSKLTSRYGADSAETTGLSASITAAPVFVGSSLNGGAGLHRVGPNTSPFTQPIAPFGFDFTKPLTVGQSGQRWTLYELVIDPPPPRGGFSG